MSSHAYHGDLKGLVLRDGCIECEGRRLDLHNIDDGNLRLLAILADHPAPEMSWVDEVAVDSLRQIARIVFRSGIKEEVAR